MAATKAKKQASKKRPRCHTCGKAIHMPKGWTVGPSVRRHYWKHHRDTMQVER